MTEQTDDLTNVWVEYDREYMEHFVVSSRLRPATREDVERVKQLPECDHSIIVDEPGWLYDFRSCYVCGAGLGAV